MGKLHALPEEQQLKLTRKGSILDLYGFLFFVFQIAMIIIFAATCEYPEYDDNTSIVGFPLRSSNYYTFYNNIALMVFIGFGFLGASFKKYGFSAIGYTFSIAAFSIQWSILTLGFFQQERAARDNNNDWQKIQLSISMLIWGLYGATANIVALSSVFGNFNFEITCLRSCRKNYPCATIALFCCFYSIFLFESLDWLPSSSRI
jgi:hypothetical protein